MNRLEFEIPPLVCFKPVVKVLVQVINISLFTFLELEVLLFDDSNTIVLQRRMRLEGDDYSRWGADDGYVIDWVKQQLNLMG